MKSPLVIGIDPGVGGGLAALKFGGQFSVTPMPKTEREVWEWISSHRAATGWNPAGYDTLLPAVAVIEKVGGYVRGNPLAGSAMFTFGMSYGGLRMALVAAGVTFHAVTPGVWQRALGIPPRKKDERKDRFKARLRDSAKELFPKVHVTLKTCDAVLIAEYARRTYG